SAVCATSASSRSGTHFDASLISVLLSKSASVDAMIRRFALHEHPLDVGPGAPEEERRGLTRDARDVRRQQQPSRRIAPEREQRMIGGGRLARVDVDGGAAEAPRLERARE